jgi:hypothetical protein
MLNEHDQDVLPRCPRLGHELTFGYCRQESRGKPCRLILDCWWERFDARAFLQANLPQEEMAQVERVCSAPPPSKVLSLVEIIQQAKDRLAPGEPSAGSQQTGPDGRKGNADREGSGHRGR